jgi:hypothetical protein
VVVEWVVEAEESCQGRSNQKLGGGVRRREQRQNRMNRLGDNSEKIRRGEKRA